MTLDTGQFSFLCCALLCLLILFFFFFCFALGVVRIRKSRRPVKSQQPVPALGEGRNTGARALCRGEPVGQARARLPGWGFLALEVPGASENFAVLRMKCQTKELQVLLESPRKCRVGSRGRGGRDRRSGDIGKSRGATSAVVLAGASPGPQAYGWRRWLLCVREVPSGRDRGPRGKVSSNGPSRPSPGPPPAVGALEPAPPDRSLSGFQALFTRGLKARRRGPWIPWLRCAARGCGGRCWVRGWPSLASARTGPEPRPRSPPPPGLPPRLLETGLATGDCGPWRSFQGPGNCASSSSC